MAIDSRQKRAAAIMAGIPFIVITPLADGSIDGADRAHIAHVYPIAGITAPAVGGEAVYGMMRMIRMVRCILLPYGSMYIE